MMEKKDSKSSAWHGQPQYLQAAAAAAAGGGYPQQEESLTSGISYPGINDVMFGRGGDTNYHIGNNSFRHLVESYSERYWAASKRKEKAKIIATILSEWRCQKPPGRFLAKTDPSQGDKSSWHEVGDSVAGRKASKILSEMRVGKKKAAGAKRKRTGEESSGSEETKKQAKEDPDNVPQAAMAYQMHDSLERGTFLQHSTTNKDSMDFLTRFQSPLRASEGMRRWENILQQQQQDSHHQFVDPVLAANVPVAASLTDVFQDQHVAPQNLPGSNSSTEESN